MGAGTGLVVGLTKMLLRLDSVPSFIDELKSMHVNPMVGSKVRLSSLVKPACQTSQLLWSNKRAALVSKHPGRHAGAAQRVMTDLSM